MSTNLTSQKIKDTYNQLLHVDGGPEAGEKTVYSGTGVGTALKVGTGSVSVDNVQLDGNTIRTLDTNGNLVLAPNGTGSVSMTKVAVTGGTITGITDLAVADGGTGASDASGARTNLGLGTIATQNSNNVSITGGAISNVVFTGSFSGITGITSDAFFTSAAAAGLTLTNNDLLADGTDTNIDIDLIPKGAGAVKTNKLQITGSFGYAPTAGGAVTQATSKSTPVTVNKLCGQITTTNSTLNRDTSVNFVVNNSLVGEFDVVVACIHSGATLGAYELDVDAVANGSFTLALRNHLSSTDLSEAITINFVVIKGTNS